MTTTYVNTLRKAFFLENSNHELFDFHDSLFTQKFTAQTLFPTIPDPMQKILGEAITSLNFCNPRINNHLVMKMTEMDFSKFCTLERKHIDDRLMMDEFLVLKRIVSISREFLLDQSPELMSEAKGIVVVLREARGL